MSSKKKGLGRGLDALLGGVRELEAGAEKDGEEPSAGPPPEERVSSLPVELIQRGRYQPRREFDPDSLRELADSIAAQGVIQPIVVRPVGEGRLRPGPLGWSLSVPWDPQTVGPWQQHRHRFPWLPR